MSGTTRHVVFDLVEEVGRDGHDLELADGSIHGRIGRIADPVGMNQRMGRPVRLIEAASGLRRRVLAIWLSEYAPYHLADRLLVLWRIDDDATPGEVRDDLAESLRSLSRE